MSGPLSGLRVLDLTRILAGPTCTQILGDLGADIIKVERPGAGDDTRLWGPPYVKDGDGADTTESAYYLCCNRNKRSVAVDIAKPEGQAIVRQLLAHCDVMIENFKVGDMARYGLSYADLKDQHPGLIYCSITGFGQTGPYAPRAGYDYLVQGMGGIMSVTGAPDGPPMKVGVAVADVVCGLYAAIAVLGALHHRQATGTGQQIDLALLDSQVSWLINVGLNYLTSGQVPQRLGNAHANIVPYTVMPCADGHMVLAIGNDAQYSRFCGFAGRPELATEERFRTNASRVRHREILTPLLEELTRRHPRQHWIDGLSALGVPCGPVNTVDQVFDDPQVQHRGMRVSMPHPLAGAGSVDLIGSPLRYSETPVDYRLPPPVLGQHTEEVLRELLATDAAAIEDLRRSGVIA